MTDNDKKRFAECWVAFHDLVGAARPSRESLALAFEILQDYPLGHIEKALEIHAKTSPFAPKPADVVKILMGSAEDRARRAWLIAKEAMNRWGSYESVSLRDPWAHYAIAAMGGWPAFGSIEEKDAPFRERDFCRHYADAERMGLSWGSTGVPDHLAGRHEINNTAKGQGGHVAAPRLVGNAEKATRVLLAGQGSLANVDGTLVAIGEKIEGHRLVSVSDRQAVFEKDGRRLVLDIRRAQEPKP